MIDLGCLEVQNRNGVGRNCMCKATRRQMSGAGEEVAASEFSNLQTI